MHRAQGYHRILLLSVLAILLLGCNKEATFQPIDENSESAYRILQGYSKRRDMIIDKNTTMVTITDRGYVFRWRSPEGDHFFLVNNINNAWQIKEVTTESIQTPTQAKGTVIP